jgi:hypothetical protein
MIDAPIKAYTLKQIAGLYGVSVQTLRGWIEKINDKVGERVGYIYTPAQVRIMFEHFDPPQTKSPNQNQQ